MASLARLILKNTLSNWVGMTVGILLALLMTPYLLKHLGNERYGIYQIVLTITNYFILLELGLRGSIARFASKYVHAGDTASLSGAIATAVWFSLLIGVVIMAISIVLGLNVPAFLKISPEYWTQTLFLIVGLGFNTVMSFVSYGFSGVLIGHNRYDLVNGRIIIDNGLRALLIVLFFSLGWVSLSSWALAFSISGFLSLAFISFTMYRIHKGISIHVCNIKKNIVNELVDFGTWNMLMQLSWFVILSANPIIISKCMGAEYVPYYSIPFMLITSLTSFVMAFSSSLVPTASSALVGKNMDLLKNLMLKGTYYSALLSFLFGGVLLVMCKSLFTVWLPPGFDKSWVVYAVLMIAFFGSTSETASYNILVGGGKIRGLAIVNTIACIIAVLLSIYFVKFLQWGIMGAVIGLVIPRFLSLCVFHPWYASNQVSLSWYRYIEGAYSRPFVCSIPSVVLGWMLTYLFPPANLTVWVIEYLVALIPAAVFLLTGVLEFPLRKAIISKFSNGLCKLIKVAQ